MIARLRRALPALGFVVPLALAGVSCQKVPLLAPSGSTITLTASATTLPVNGTTALVAQVIESAGTVPHSGTRVTFTTNLGTIQPAAANTDVNGQAQVTFNAGSASGTATITATSGGVGGTTTTTTGTTTTSSSSNTVKIAIGAAAVGHVGVAASPATVPSIGGDSTITANVLDTNGSPLTSVAVSFSTTAGNLSSAFVTTDGNGQATTVLHTAAQAVVTASVGAAGSAGGTPPSGSTSGTSSGTVTVGINGAPTIIITPPSGGVTAGLPATFTFAITAAATNGSAIKDVTVNWGDGRSQDLGAISGSTPVTHAYQAAGSYTITAAVTDASLNSISVAVPVTVNPPALALVITPPSSPPGAGLPAVFTFAPTVPAGDVVRNVTVNWGDGVTTQDLQDLGALTGSASVSHVFPNATSYTVTGTLTDIGGNSINVSTGVTVIAVPLPTIIITPTVTGTSRTVSFLVQVTVPTGLGVQSTSINFGEPGAADQPLGGLTGTVTLTHAYATGVGTSFTVTVTVVDNIVVNGLNRSTRGQTTVTISP